MTVSDALAATATVLLLPNITIWIIAGFVHSDETVSVRRSRPTWFWPGIFGGNAAITLIVLFLYVCGIWTGVR